MQNQVENQPAVQSSSSQIILSETSMDRRITQRVQNRSSLQSWLMLADSSKRKFSGKIIDRSMKGYKLLINELHIPSNQVLQIIKEGIDGATIKINVVVVWSKEIIINGKHFTEVGIKV